MMNKTANAGFKTNLSLEQFENVSFMIQSKDKRHQLHAADVKMFILEDNNRRNMISNQKR